MENANSNFKIYSLGATTNGERERFRLEMRCETTGRWHSAPLILYREDFGDLMMVLKAQSQD